MKEIKYIMLVYMIILDFVERKKRGEKISLKEIGMMILLIFLVLGSYSILNQYDN